MKLRLFQVIEAPMAPLNPRQQKAAAVAKEISRLGGFVISPLPLRDDERELRVQILDKDKHIVQEIESWGWRLTSGYPLPRVSHASFVPATVYRLEIPMERQAIADDRVIKGESAIERDKQAERESNLMLRHIGWRK